MSKIDCGACTDLRENAPEFVQNGVTDTICASLKNNTGLNPSLSPLHTDCEDLEDANDCLVRRMANDIDAYDVCEWKDFMQKFIPNLGEYLKAVNCSDCGQWTKIENLEDRLYDLCQIVNNVLNNNMVPYGILPGLQWQAYPERMGGEIMTKDGTPLVVNEEEDTDHNWNGVGVYYLRKTLYNCDGVRKTYEWIQPYFRDFYYNTNAAYNDIIWRASISQLRTWGMSDSLINTLRTWPQWWDGYSRSWGQYFESTLYLGVEGDYLVMKLIGSLGDFHNVVVNGSAYKPFLVIS